jgi:hypothetical protein
MRRPARTPAVNVRPSKWSLEDAANPTAPQGNLVADACTSPTSCVAVGSDNDSSGVQVSLAETWNGTTWDLESTPNPVGATDSELEAVSCSSATACTAVGYYRNTTGMSTLAERWNGITWSLQTTPNPASISSQLDSVSCGSAGACVAVGVYEASVTSSLTLAEVWNGAAWSIKSTINPPGSSPYGASLAGVSCSSARACIAVGGFSYVTGEVALTEAWNGTTWNALTDVNPAGSSATELEAVSCRSAAACTAVGVSLNSSSGDEVTLAEVWNGADWSAEATPNPRGATEGIMLGVSCRSALACTAVGRFSKGSGLFTLAETWNGTTWAIHRTPVSPGTTDSALDGVSCGSVSVCSAVGFFDTASGALPRVEAWNGTAWTVQSAPNPAGPPADSDLDAVSCSSAIACTAVGSFDSSSDQLTLAERWNGTGWTLETTPNPAGAPFPGSFLYGVSCSSSNACMAVGSSSNAAATPLTLAESWNGRAWKLRPTPNPTGTTNSALEAVSCSSAAACTAVGFFINSSNTEVAMTETWNGTAWTIQTTPVPSGATYSELSGVSCRADACKAVGSYYDSAGAQAPLAESWDGTAWRIRTTPVPAGAVASSLVGVSCSMTADCTAVGHSYDLEGTEVTLAESWNGTAWKVLSTPNPKGATSSFLDGGVSCGDATSCLAVGSYSNASGTPFMLAESWNGSAWRVETTPDPKAAVERDLGGVSCASATVCTGVGYFADSLFNERTLAENSTASATPVQS